ncbi:hypothetical protein QN277_020179 [Acacia crassicarpa]|uniref:Uncharacterized protein n=1 Tax=Acacia crassicarpa TaxID=499986 RepID=A0AAE1KCQ2_9FABA|nr:hypothetical protein QN277_020179 [Acacia crassicarpa]
MNKNKIGRQEKGTGKTSPPPETTVEPESTFTPEIIVRGDVQTKAPAARGGRGPPQHPENKGAPELETLRTETREEPTPKKKDGRRFMSLFRPKSRLLLTHQDPICSSAVVVV